MNKHLPQLDGLRGLAILIVFAGHLLVFRFGLGLSALGPIPPTGVDLFFVLSGFLITRILLESRTHANYYGSFYIRRALRIWPLYFLVLAFLFGVANHRIPGLTFDEERIHWPVFALYVQNLFYKQATDMGPLYLAITWSLAVEEQFYGIWPVVVRKISTRGLTYLLFGTIALGPVARLIVPRFGVDPYINPLCRFDAMAMGGLLAIWAATGKLTRASVVRGSVIVFGLAIPLELLCHYLGLTHYLSKTIVAAVFAAVLALALHSGPLARALSNRALRWLGKVSYCVYLVHAMVAAVVVSLWPGNSVGMALFRMVLIGAATLTVAGLSWRLFEGPILAFKKYFPSRKVEGLETARTSEPLYVPQHESTHETPRLLTEQ